VRPLAVTLLSAVLAVSACGSESRVKARPAPKLPRGVATSLAARSDVLAASLRRRDGCAAMIQMHGLERQTRLAIAAGRVPVVFRARLLAAERRLAARLPRCVPPAPPPPPPLPAPVENKHGKKKHDEDHGKKKGHGKGEGD
jgi:hypothetical protein